MPPPGSETHLQSALADVRRLLDRHQVLAAIAARQVSARRDLLEDLQQRQNQADLQRRLSGLHAADVAYVLENLPVEDRERVWAQVVPADRAGQVLVEASDAVRASLVAGADETRLSTVLATLDAEDLAYLAPALPAEVVARASAGLAGAERTVFDEASRYLADTVGALMTREWVEVGDTATIGQVLDVLRSRGELPPQCDRVFVVDQRHVLVGTVALPSLLVQGPDVPVLSVAQTETPTLGPFDAASDAVHTFQRYELVSAPVVDDRGKLIGRLTVDAALDVMRDQATLQALRTAGLQDDEDLFAAPIASARNRWPWLGVNLVTAFAVSRVIGQFETTIAGLAPLAALMPIVASIGGNTGNQTMALVIRALAVAPMASEARRRLLRKELVVSVLNGGVWGLLVGVFAVVIYRDAALGAVMTTAVVLNLVVAAVTGVGVPLLLSSAGRDPAHGSSVLLTFVTDAMGCFLFLGLAHLFLA